jgi:C4-dicarboxylate-specific signal transduction histidine kinase
MADEIDRLRTVLRDLVALSTIPAAWVGREPPMIAAGLADVLVGSLYLDFAFVRLRDPNGGAAINVTRGKAWKEFPEWLQSRLAALDEHPHREIIRDIDGGAESYCGLVIPIAINGDGGFVAVACDRTDFPTETDQLLLSVAANQAATAFQSARLIHERRRAEEQLRHARDELEMKVAERTDELRRIMSELAHVNRSITAGELSATIAHEVKQPLAAITANGSAALRWLTKATPDLDQARAALGHIIHAAHHAGDIIDTIRSMFKKSDQEKVPVNLNGLIEEVLGLVRGDLQRRRILVKTDLGASLPFVLANRVQLQQVILNLLVNAAEAMDSVTNRDRLLKVASERQTPSDVLITVEDSGPGMEPEKIKRIFEPFYTTKPDGMGMGLSICRSIVESHGGRLFATPRRDWGLAMQVSLPATACAEALVVDAERVRTEK